MCVHIQREKRVIDGEHKANDPKTASFGNWDIDGTSLYGVVIAYLQGQVSNIVSSLI